jgi:ASC-1-like (ASCH) protein
MKTNPSGRIKPMPDWQTLIANNLVPAVQGNKFWEENINQMLRQSFSPFAIHLAVFMEPFLQYVLDGSKKIESRFSSVRCAPYNSVQAGDIILLKKTGGPVVGLCKVTSVWFYELEGNSLQEIREKYAKALCADDPSFWEHRKEATFATLMRIKHVHRVAPIKIEKKDRRGWVVLRAASDQLNLLSGRL